MISITGTLARFTPEKELHIKVDLNSFMHVYLSCMNIGNGLDHPYYDIDGVYFVIVKLHKKQRTFNVWNDLLRATVSVVGNTQVAGQKVNFVLDHLIVRRMQDDQIDGTDLLITVQSMIRDIEKPPFDSSLSIQEKNERYNTLRLIHWHVKNKSLIISKVLAEDIRKFIVYLSKVTKDKESKPKA